MFPTWGSRSPTSWRHSSSSSAPSPSGRPSIVADELYTGTSPPLTLAEAAILAGALIALTYALDHRGPIAMAVVTPRPVHPSEFQRAIRGYGP